MGPCLEISRAQEIAVDRLRCVYRGSLFSCRVVCLVLLLSSLVACEADFDEIC